MGFLDVQWAGEQNVITTIIAVVASAATSLITGVTTYFLTRQKSRAEIHKTESDTVTNLYGIIERLQGEVDSWYEKVRKSREESSRLEDQAREKEAIFRLEKSKLYEQISSALHLAQRVEHDTDLFPEYPELKREMIRIVELLTFLRGKLSPERPENKLIV